MVVYLNIKEKREILDEVVKQVIHFDKDTSKGKIGSFQGKKAVYSFIAILGIKFVYFGVEINTDFISIGRKLWERFVNSPIPNISTKYKNVRLDLNYLF